jgi:hypothetical protein
MTIARIPCIFLAFCCSLSISAQKQGHIWYFGDHAGLDFNEDPPAPLLDGQTYFPFGQGWNEGCSAISDSAGALIFYTNGRDIWNRLHEVMPNGGGLMGHPSSTQSSVIVPRPGSERFFYVFTTDALENNFLNGLRYSVVDMCLDDYKGDVLATAKNILLLSTVSEKLCVVRHANNVDYWIITHGLNSDAFYAFLLTASGISDPVISNTGTFDVQGWGGQMVVSPNRELMAYAIPAITDAGRTLLLSFDPATGVVSDERTLSIGGREYGVSFSPDNSKLYFSTIGIGELFQYDLNAGNLDQIIASKTYLAAQGVDSWRQHQLGPDGKIYISRAVSGSLPYIEFPNEPYPECNLVEPGVDLGGQFSSWGLPAFITGYDYSNTKLNCLLESVDAPVQPEGLRIIPNPAEDFTGIALPESQRWNIVIYSASGRLVYSASSQTGVVTMNTSALDPGLYLVKVSNERTLLSGKLVKE